MDVIKEIKTVLGIEDGLNTDNRSLVNVIPSRVYGALGVVDQKELVRMNMRHIHTNEKISYLDEKKFISSSLIFHPSEPLKRLRLFFDKKKVVDLVSEYVEYLNVNFEWVDIHEFVVIMNELALGIYRRTAEEYTLFNKTLLNLHMQESKLFGSFGVMYSLLRSISNVSVDTEEALADTLQFELRDPYREGLNKIYQLANDIFTNEHPDLDWTSINKSIVYLKTFGVQFTYEDEDSLKKEIFRQGIYDSALYIPDGTTDAVILVDIDQEPEDAINLIIYQMAKIMYIIINGRNPNEGDADIYRDKLTQMYLVTMRL